MTYGVHFVVYIYVTIRYNPSMIGTLYSGGRKSHQPLKLKNYSDSPMMFSYHTLTKPMKTSNNQYKTNVTNK